MQPCKGAGQMCGVCFTHKSTHAHMHVHMVKNLAPEQMPQNHRHVASTAKNFGQGFSNHPNHSIDNMLSACHPATFASALGRCCVQVSNPRLGRPNVPVANSRCTWPASSTVRPNHTRSAFHKPAAFLCSINAKSRAQIIP